MCVTNNVRRAPRSFSVPNPSSMIAKTPSMLSERLVENYMPPMMQATASNHQYGAPRNTSCDIEHAGYSEKPRTKKTRRRRKPQKPGKTAKLNDRHFVVHNYHDHAGDAPENDVHEEPPSRRRGGVSMSFPLKLHAILDQVEADGLADVISWQPHGRCFLIHKPKQFIDHVMPNYFRQTKLTSFQRQLNLYGFCRLTIGNDNGGYYHELFLRGKVFLAKRMTRTKVKGTKFKAASSPEQEPDFYSMPPVTVTPNTTSDEASSNEEDSFSSQMLEPIPLFSQMTQQQQQPHVVNCFVPSLMSTQWRNFSQQPTSTNDSLFDAAVDEVFSNEDLASAESDFKNIWDPSMEVNQKIVDDEQLGFLLEQILEQN